MPAWLSAVSTLLSPVFGLLGVWLGTHLNRTALQRSRVYDRRQKSYKDLLARMHKSVSALSHLEEAALNALHATEPGAHAEAIRAILAARDAAVLEMYELVNVMSFAVIVQSDNFLQFNNQWQAQFSAATPELSEAADGRTTCDGPAMSPAIQALALDARRKREHLMAVSGALVLHARQELAAIS
jgi:hypothetical protein